MDVMSSPIPMDTTLLDPTPMGTQDLMLMRIHTGITIPIIKRYGSRTVGCYRERGGDVKGAKALRVKGALAFFAHGAYHAPRVRPQCLWPLQSRPKGDGH